MLFGDGKEQRMTSADSAGFQPDRLDAIKI